MENSRQLITYRAIRSMTMTDYMEFRTAYGATRDENGLNYEIYRENWARMGEISWLEKMLEYVND